MIDPGLIGAIIGGLTFAGIGAWKAWRAAETTKKVAAELTDKNDRPTLGALSESGQEGTLREMLRYNNEITTNLALSHSQSIATLSNQVTESTRATNARMDGHQSELRNIWKQLSTHADRLTSLERERHHREQ